MKAVRKNTGSRNNNDSRTTNGRSTALVPSSNQQPPKRSIVPAVTPPTTVELRGIPIHFPFQPYKCQEEYMGTVLDALLRSQNALLESPTGTGKTLCLLCSALAWQREQARLLKSQGDYEIPGGGGASALQQQQPPQRKRRVPTIIYASRTHSQLSQVVRELRNTRYRPKHAVLGSREQMCVNPKVKKPDGTSTASAINHDCSVLNRERRCKFKNKVEGFKAPSNESSSQGAWHGTQPVMDMEDLVSMGKTHQVCPFYYTREHVVDAELVLVPYNYLFDKDSRSTTLQDIPWDNSVVIFDEAHNLESFASESASFDLSSKDIAGCMGEIDKALNLSEAYPEQFANIKMQNLLRLKAIFLNLEEYLLKKLPQQSTSYQGERIMEIFQQGAEINHDNHDLVLREIKKILDMFMEIRGGNSKGAPKLEHFVQCIKRVFGEPNLARCLAKAQSYRVHLTQVNNSSNSAGKGDYKSNSSDVGRTLSYWCFAPSEAMRELAALNVRSILVTSGTLSPLESYALELDIPFPNRLENPHIISPHQIHVRVMGRGVSNKVLTSSYERRQNNDYYIELGNTLATLSRVVPCGMLVFFPSYGVMETAIERWGGPSSSRSSNTNNASNFFAAKKRKSGGGSGNSARYSFPQIATNYSHRSSDQTNTTPWKRLLSHKAVVVEPRSTSDLPDAIAEFHRFLNLPHSKGVALFGVCRGKISEGIDFSHDMCRAVIITGLPFAPSFDPKVKMKREFLDQKKAKQTARASTNGGFGAKDASGENLSLSGHDWYTQQAHRAVNQAIGRVIRNKRDYGAVILMDSRFGLPGNQNGLSKWVRPHILPDEGFGRANQNLVQFYVKARQHAENEAELLAAQQTTTAARPTNVSMILKYEDEGKENNLLASSVNEDDVTKVAFIKNEPIEKKDSDIENSSDGNFIDPQRVIARVDMDTLSQKQMSSSPAAPTPQQARSDSLQTSSRTSSTSHNHNPKVVRRGSLPVSPAVKFFQLVKSTMTQDEFNAIKKGVVLLKKYEQFKFRTEFITAVRPIIEIILLHEPLWSKHSRNKKSTILVLLLQLLPKHFLKEAQDVAVDQTFRNSKLREELKVSIQRKVYMKLHMGFVDWLREVWFDASTETKDTQLVQSLVDLLGKVSESHQVSKLALSQLVDIVPSELRRLTLAVVEEMKASIDMSKIRAGEKARTGEDSVKVEYFRRSYLIQNNKGSIETKQENARNSGSSDPENQINDSRATNSQVDSRRDAQTFSKMKTVKNPYAKENLKTRPRAVDVGINTTSTNSNVAREKRGLSTLLAMKKDDIQKCHGIDGSSSISSSSLKTILRQSGADVYAGETKKLRRTIFSSNAPKDVKCTICEMVLEKLYISECGHMACLQCWHQWLARSDTCPQCRKPTTMKSIALAVFKGNA